jgi:hypothetical protein
MSASDFTALPDDARCWVFAADRALDASAALTLLTIVERFLAEWRAHGQPLRGAREWRANRFLAIAVDERAVGASGCSVDALFRSLKSAEPHLGATVVSGGTLFWRASDSTIQAGTREEFVAAWVRGELSDATPVFDTTLTSVGQWRSTFERPLATSWHARLKPASASV